MKKSRYIEEYESNDEHKGYNVLGGGENSYWNWRSVLSAYIKNTEKLNHEIETMKHLKEKVCVSYATIIYDMYKKSILVKSKKTGKIKHYKNILSYCYRSENGEVNNNSKTNIKRNKKNPKYVLLQCKKSCGDNTYCSVFSISDDKDKEFYFYNKHSDIVRNYQEQIKNREKQREMVKTQMEEKKLNRVNKCAMCGKEYRHVSKYCSTCRRVIDTDKLKQGKKIKKCTVCAKEHVRQHDTCSTQCTNKLRNMRRKLIG